MRARAGARVVVGALLALVAASGCRGRDSESPRPIDSEKGRFPHARHAQVPCVECHPREAVLAGRPARPGAMDHQPCDRGSCHRTEFLGRPGRFCRVCHQRVAPGVEGGTRPAAYPPVTGRRALAAEFSHQAHLDQDAIEERVGFHVSCSDCHAPGGAELVPPGHAVCGRCHAPEAAPKGAPTMNDCVRCHRERPAQPSRLRRFIVGDLRFDHARHRQDRAGAIVRCAECHTGSAQATSPGDHAAPAMKACVECHDDSERTPADRRMRVCETCHATRQERIGAIAPRSHLPASERPEDHTRAFRRDHAADAAADPQRCARCHTFMSGARRDTCDDCHRIMRPSDHQVTWREFDHGPAAAARTDGCATCHQGDFCVACHGNVRPRSHFPAIAYREGGHGVFARTNLRACVACHQVDGFCANSLCHPSGATAR